MSSIHSNHLLLHDELIACDLERRDRLTSFRASQYEFKTIIGPAWGSRYLSYLVETRSGNVNHLVHLTRQTAGSLLCDEEMIDCINGTSRSELIKQICDLAEATMGSHGLIEAMDSKTQADRNTIEAIAITAAALGLTRIVRRMISNGCNVNARSDLFGHILTAAASSGKTEVVSFLLDNGAQLPAGVPNYNYCRPGYRGLARLGSRMYNSTLQAAAVNGHNNIIQLFFEKIPPEKLAKDDQRQAILSAAMAGHLDTMYLLVDYWSSQDERPDFNNMLWEAAANGHDPLVRSLLKQGVDPNTCANGSFKTPLQIAAFHGRTSTVDILIRGHAMFRLSSTYDEGDAMTCAVRHGFLGTAKLLLDYGYPVDGLTLLTSPLAGAVNGGEAHMVEWLLQNGATLHQEEESSKASGGALLCHAFRLGYRSVVEILIKHGVTLGHIISTRPHFLFGRCYDDANATCCLDTAGFEARFFHVGLCTAS